VAFRLTATNSKLPVPVRAEVVLIRWANITIMIMHMSVSTVDTAKTESTARRALRLVEERL
jgi:hypothetical protein